MSFRTRCASARLAVIDGGSAAAGPRSQPRRRARARITKVACRMWARDGDTPHHSRQAHREGPVRHGSSTLAAVADTGNREPGPKSQKAAQNAPNCMPVRRRAECGTVERFVAGAKSSEHLLLAAFAGFLLSLVCPAAGPAQAPGVGVLQQERGGAERPGAGGSRPALRRSKAACHRPAATLRASTREAAALARKEQTARRELRAAQRTRLAPSAASAASSGTSTSRASRTRSRSSSGRPRWTRRSTAWRRPSRPPARLEMVLEQSTRREAAVSRRSGRRSRSRSRQAQIARDRVARRRRRPRAGAVRAHLPTSRRCGRSRR